MKPSEKEKPALPPWREFRKMLESEMFGVRPDWGDIKDVYESLREKYGGGQPVPEEWHFLSECPKPVTFEKAWEVIWTQRQYWSDRNEKGARQRWIAAGLPVKEEEGLDPDVDLVDEFIASRCVFDSPAYNAWNALKEKLK